ncbi:MAG: lycopene cyclase domain-containing protein [Bacteroidetes bacterium]|nr:lycopene cyclase domain-containing protein [Bacteroidota bacterium]
MQAKLTYLLVDIGAFLVPFLFSFHPKINFYKVWKSYLPANLFVTLVFLIWDIYYTKIGVWGFNDKYILGIKLFNLPVEEVLFFICIPYSSIFTYYCFKLFYPKVQTYSFGLVSAILVAILVFVGFFSLSKLYTSVTFILLAILIVYLAFVKKKEWLSNFYLMFLIILLPFFIVNGILTGTGLSEPVVWYNNSENLGFRILTIPIEDIFYGMLLLLLNTFLFESFRKKNA